jgi:flagellar motor switch protein FliM
LAEILSQDEINALLAAYGSANSSTEADSFGGGSGTPGREVRLYDFLSPDRFSKEHLRTLNTIHSNFAGGLSATLSGLYQLPTRVSLIGVDQVSYKEYRASVPTKTLIAEVSAEPLTGCMLLEVNPSVVGMWVDYLCGGNTQISALPSELTAIDLTVARRVLSSCLPIYSDSWSGMIAMNPEVRTVSNSESYDEPMVPSEPVLVCSLEINTGEPVGMMTVCIPAVGVEAVLPNLSSSKLIRGSSKQDRLGAERIRKLMDQVNLPCRVVLGNASIALSEARNLKVGDVIKTECPADGQLDMHVGHAHLFNCRPGMRGKNVAVVVTSANTSETQQATPDADRIGEQIAA